MKPHSFCHRNLESGTFSFVIDSSKATFLLKNTNKTNYEVRIREKCYRLLNRPQLRGLQTFSVGRVSIGKGEVRTI
jgi:hypothetical protein